ncbi:phenylacetate--CoA ligase family protein [Maridesulfovibrio hydrothermalis]|nr:phenylacetate--CoA ligase [Maridesulfovibrio hydrothermalis]
MSKRDLLADQIQNQPFGSNLCVDRNRLARIHRTSGTTNRPLLLALTDHDLDVVTSVGSRGFKISGMHQDEIVFNCMNYSMWMGGFTDHASLERTGAAVVPYSVGNTEALVALLLEFDSPSLHSTPSYLNIIKRVLKEKFGKNPKDLGMKAGYFGGEPGMQNKAFRERIENEWGMRAMNANYGMSDVLSMIGSEGLDRDGLHYLPGPHLHLELMDTDGNLVPVEKGAIGEAIFTNLDKECQPVIRYRSGDIFHIISEVERSNGLDFKFNVVGRADDMLVVKGINFFPESLRSIISKHAELSGNYQVEIPSEEPVEHITVKVETAHHVKDKELAKLLQAEIRKNLFISPDIKLVEHLSKNGNKLKSIVRI